MNNPSGEAINPINENIEKNTGKSSGKIIDADRFPWNFVAHILPRNDDVINHAADDRQNHDDHENRQTNEIHRPIKYSINQ